LVFDSANLDTISSSGALEEIIISVGMCVY
jgi:hypothetical protein